MGLCTMVTVYGSHLSKAQVQSAGGSSYTFIHSCLVAITLSKCLRISLLSKFLPIGFGTQAVVIACNFVEGN